MLCSIFILFGCGSDETAAPIADPMPNYFPDTVGSRWTYRNPDGAEWTQTVTDADSIQGEDFRVFAYTPEASEDELDYLKPDAVRVTDSQVLFSIAEKIDHYVQNRLSASVQDDFEGLALDIAVVPIAHPASVFCQLPLTPQFPVGCPQHACQRQYCFTKSRPAAVPV